MNWTPFNINGAQWGDDSDKYVIRVSFLKASFFFKCENILFVCDIKGSASFTISITIMANQLKFCNGKLSLLMLKSSFVPPP